MVYNVDMTLIELKDKELSTLKKYRFEAPSKLMKNKSDAILLLAQGADVEFVAIFADRQPSTILTWIREWKKYRLASIHSNHLNNLNASKLTEDQRAEIMKVLASPPSEADIPADFWTVPHLAEWVESEFDVTYESDSSYHFLLHMAGLSFHKPEAVDKRKAPKAKVKDRMKEIDAELAEAYEDPDHVIFAADEVRIEHEAIVRRAWIKKGEKTEIKVDRKRQSQSYIGYLDQKTGEVVLDRLDWQNSTKIVDSLTSLVERFPKKKISIVWDNAAWHRSKELRAQLGEGNPLANIRLINMPPYSPDHNPIEHVWGEAKASISNSQRAHFDHTRDAFESFIQSNKFPYRLERF